MPDTVFPPSVLETANADALPFAYVRELDDMCAALTPEIDAAIWNRSMPIKVQDWINTLPARSLPSGRFVLAPSQAAACMKDLFRTRGVSASPALSWLCEDAERLAHMVASLVRTDLVRLRLEPVYDNACSKLHIDNVVARLICTYRGPGSVLGLAPETESGLQTIPTGLPVLLKGKRWPASRAPELRHRSPAIEGTGETRLVLVLEGCTEKDIFPTYDDIYQS
ncbi:MAG: DUF1826 domain-containing protein [Pseudomonadota bacterium]